MRNSKIILISVLISVLILLIIFFIVYYLIKHFTPVVESVCLNGPDYVPRVIDGDTFELCSGDTIRLLCVDTPEEGEEGYEEAKLFLEDLILYKEISLNSSNYGGNNTDKYERLLRWVYILDENEEKILINKLIIDEDYGELMIIPPETCSEITEIIVD